MNVFVLGTRRDPLVLLRESEDGTLVVAVHVGSRARDMVEGFYRVEEQVYCQHAQELAAVAASSLRALHKRACDFLFCCGAIDGVASP